MLHPKENRTHPAYFIIEQFRHKGYTCQQLKEDDSTVIILRYEKRSNDLSMAQKPLINHNNIETHMRKAW